MAIRSDAEFVESIRVQDEASPQLEKISDQAKATSNRLADLALLTTGLNQALELASKAWAVVKSTVEESIGAYEKVAEAQHELVTAMQITGQYSEENIKDFRQFTTSLAENTLITKGQVTEMLRHAQALGLNHDKTKLMIKTAVGLSTVLREDVNQSFEKLIMLNGGMTRGLARMFPELKSMTKEGHDGGKAIEYLATQVEHFAEAEAGTRHGQSEQFHKQLKLLKIALGEVFVTLIHGEDSTAGTPFMEAAIQMARDLTAAIKSTKAEIIEIRKTIMDIGKALFAAFSAIDWKAIAAEIALVGAAFLYLIGIMNVFTEVAAVNMLWAAFDKGLGIVSRLSSAMFTLVTAIAAYTAQALVFVTTNALIITGLATIAFTVELITRNFTKLGDVWTVVWTALYGGVLEISKAVAESGLSRFSRPIEEINADLDELADKADKASQNLDFGVTGNAIETIQGAIGEFKKTYLEAQSAIEHAGHGTGNMNRKKASPDLQQAEAALKLIAEVEQKRNESAFRLAELSATEYEKITLKNFAEKQNLILLGQKVTASKDLTEQQKKQLQAILESTQELKNQGIIREQGALSTQKYLDANASLEDVQRELNKMGMDAVELAEEEMLWQTKLNEEKISELQIDRINNAEALEALYARRELIKQLGAAKIDEAEGGTIFGNLIRQMDKTKDALDNQFSETFAKGISIFKQIEAANKASASKPKDSKEYAPLNSIYENIALTADQFGFEAGLAVTDFFSQSTSDIISQTLDSLESGAKEVGLFIWDAFDASVTFLVNNIDDAFEFGADMLGGAFASGAADMLEGLAGFTDVWTDAFKRIEKSLSTLLNSFPKAIQHVISKIPDIAAKFAAAAPEIARALANAAPSLTTAIVKSMPMIIKAVADGLVILMAALPDIIDQLAKGLPGIIRALAEALPRVFDALVQAMPAIAEALADNAGPIAEAITTGLIYASGRIVASLVKHLLMDGGLERIAGAILRGIRDGLIGLIKGIGKGFAALFGGMKIEIPDIDKLKDAGKAIKEAFTGDKSNLFSVKDLVDEATGGNIFDQISGLIQDIDTAAKKAGKTIWQSFVDEFNKLLDWFKKRGKEIWDGLVDAFNTVADWFAKRGKEIWDNFILPVARWFADRGKEIWDGFILPVAKWFADRGKEIWDGFLSPVADWFKQRGLEIWQGFISMVGQLGQMVRDAFASVSSILTDAFKPITDLFGGKTPQVLTALTSGFAPILALFGGPTPLVVGTIATAFGPVLSVFGGAAPTLTTTVSNAWKPITDIFGGKSPSLVSTVSQAFEPVTSWKFPPLPNMKTAGGDIGQGFWDKLGVLGIGNKGADMASGLWNKLEQLGIGNKGADIASGFWNKLDQLGVGNKGSDIASGFWNKLIQLNVGLLGENIAAGMWNKLITLDWKSLIGGGGGGGGIKIPGFAHGGEIKSIQYFADGGFARGTDTVPAMVTPGEFVVNRRAAQNNLPALKSLNAGGSISSNVVIHKIEINAANLTAEQIASQVIPKIDQHLKRKSQDGGFVVSKAGIRS